MYEIAKCIVEPWALSQFILANKLSPAVVSLATGESEVPRASGAWLAPPHLLSPTKAVFLALTGHPRGLDLREDCLSTWPCAAFPGAKN